MTKKNGKKSELTSGATSGKEVVGYGGNNNLTPGNPGNKGGVGQRPHAIREHCRGSFAQRVAILEAIADGEPLPMTKIDGDETKTIQVSAAIRERAQAIDMLGKYGGVAELSLTVDEQPEQAMTPERIAGLFEQLQRIKTVKQLEKLLVGAAKKQGEG